MKIEKVELNRAGVGKLLKSDAVLEEVSRVGKSLGTVETEYIGFDRAHVVVVVEE